jgi:hypothetical protein
MTQPNTQRICWIKLTRYFGAGISNMADILTVLFERESLEQIEDRLVEAIAEIDPEYDQRVLTPDMKLREKDRPAYYRVRATPFEHADNINSRLLFESVRITQNDDRPGAPTVHIVFSSQVKYFLPRDPATGNFTDLSNQTMCLEALMVQPKKAKADNK